MTQPSTEAPKYKAVIYSDIDTYTRGEEYIGSAKIYKIGEGEIAHGIAKTQGNTKPEVEEAMRIKVREWIAKQGGVLAEPLN